MQVVDRQQAISRLRTQIEGIENRPVSEGHQVQRRRYIIKAPDEKFVPAPAGLLHEVWMDGPRNGGSAFGFALGQARALLGRSRPAILFLQLAHEAQQTGLPYGPGLYHFGLCLEALIIGRVRNVTELLWAAEEAAGCKAVAAIIVDIIHPGKILDFTASRRLAMRAQRGEASIFLLRYGHQREAGASHLRWHVAPVSSMEAPFDVRAPGVPRWQVNLEKGQGMVSDRPGYRNWTLNWTENGFALEQAVGTDKGARKTRAEPALSGPLPTSLGHGLSETA